MTRFAERRRRQHERSVYRTEDVIECQCCKEWAYRSEAMVPLGWTNLGDDQYICFRCREDWQDEVAS